jgi:high-affinity nickel-transport protein
LLVAGLGLARLLLPAVDAWTEGKELLFGLVVVLLIVSAYFLARAMARRAQPA